MLKKLFLATAMFCIPFCLLADEFMFKHLDVKDGLSNSHVNAILKSSDGFMWFATASGLNRYDGNQVKVFRSYDAEAGSLPSNLIEDLQEDVEGNLWIHNGSSYIVYDSDTEKLDWNVRSRLKKMGIEGYPANIYIDSAKDMWVYMGSNECYVYRSSTRKLGLYAFKDGQLPNGSVTDISECKEGILFIYDSGAVVCLDKSSRKVKWKLTELQGKTGKVNPDVYSLFVDKDGDLWIYSPSGLWVYSILKRTWESRLCSLVKQYSYTMIRAVAQDKHGNIWIGKDRVGIDILNKSTGEIKTLRNRANDERSLQNNTVTALYEDINGVMWVGTYKKGISFYSESTFKFGINHVGDVNCIEEDRNGWLWLGMNDAGLKHWNYKSDDLQTFIHKENNNSLTANTVVCLLHAKDGKLWIGTFWGGLDCYVDGRFLHYKNIPENKNSLVHNNVWALAEDRAGNIWIGTLGGGVQCFNPRTGVFTTYTTKNAGLLSDYISSLYINKENVLLMGTAIGVSVMDIATRKITNFAGTKSGKTKLSNLNVNQVYQDSRGLIWIATCDGLNVYQPKTDELKVLSLEDGLSGSYIVGIAEDNDKDLWVTTATGVDHIVPSLVTQTRSYTFRCYAYDVRDGLQDSEFNQRSIKKLSSGEILMGGLYGINHFRTDEIKYNKVLPRVLFTGLSIFNENIEPGHKYDGKVVLKKALNRVDKIDLNYQQNVFSIRFAADDYILPRKVKYAYNLEGFNKSWLTVTSGLVSYTNLAPGHYTLHVKAINSDGYVGDTESLLNINILPPFWLTTWAYIIYVIILAALLYLTYYLVLRRERNKFYLQQIKREAEKDKELNDLKLRFFTNVSHELRTPLTLIISPLDALIKKYEGKEVADKLSMVHRNANRLMILVNQLLDFRKGDVNGHHLTLSEGDVVSFIDNICSSFLSLSEKRNIRLTFESEVPSLNMAFDEDKLEKIVLNLLSNAFKFTHEGGKVNVIINRLDKSDSSKMLEIRIADTGIGIEDKDKERIFERFYQANNRGVHVSGSGIGLSLVYDFVTLHEGTVYVEDNVGGGSVFIVCIPAKHPEVTPVRSEIVGENRPLILVVDDNDDFLTFMHNSLSKDYRVKLAVNGNDAWEQMRDMLPELVISDVMMPEMDGNQLCKLMKSDKRTKDVPLILLTARHSDEYKVEGLISGADDYITKPFNWDILRLKIKKLLEARMQKRLHIEPEPGNIVITSLDEKLIEHAVRYVENKISCSELSVEELSRELGMSRVHLYKKLLAITNKTPIEFIRVIRLKRAAQLLRESQLNVSEIAYQVGFNNPKYFSKYFKDEYGVLPSVYQEKEGT